MSVLHQGKTHTIFNNSTSSTSQTKNKKYCI